MLFDLRIDKCYSCGKGMMNKDKYNLFPYYRENTQEVQMLKNGIVFTSRSTVDGERICIECEAMGKASFVCALCGERFHTNEIQESFGSPPDHLCKKCFKNVTAEVWMGKVDQLENDHKYDYD